jgi:hypothetical protein
LDKTPKTQEINPKPILRQTNKIPIFSTRKQFTEKRQPTEGEKVLMKDMSKKWLISRLYKEQKKLNGKEINKPIENGQQT